MQIQLTIANNQRPAPMTNITFAPAHQIASLIRDRSTSAVEVLNAQQLNGIGGNFRHPPAHYQ
jgi:hypothetical protein